MFYFIIYYFITDRYIGKSEAEQTGHKENGHKESAVIPVEVPDPLKVAALPYNLYWRKGHRVHNEAIKDLDTDTQEQIGKNKVTGTFSEY